MDKHRDLDSWHQCRLCGIFGYLKIDIFDEKSRPGPSNASELSSDIFRCVEVRVGRGDKTTKLCGHCFGEIHHYIGFRAVCAATDRNMQSSDDIIDETISTDQCLPNAASSSDPTVLRNRFPLIDPFVECISLIDDESESENAETDAPRDIACDKQSTDVGVTSFDGKRAPAMKHRNADLENADETRKRMNEEPDCNANSTSSHDDGCAAHATRRNLIRNEKTTKSAFDNHERDELLNATGPVTCEPCDYSVLTKATVACDALTDDEMNSDFGMFAVLVQKGKTSERNGKFSDKSAKTDTVKNVSNIPVECVSRSGCKESFESWDAMMFHTASYHAKGIKRTFCCHLCKKTFSIKGSLQRHMNSVHNRETRFICPIRRCAKIFTQKSSLERHTNAVHTKRVTFRCTKCPMKFYYKHLLTRHLANKHGVGMTFSCYLCKIAICGKQSLQRHMNSLHTGQVRFTCPFPMCSKSFTRKSILNVHTNAIHTKKNVFKCTECDKEFYDKSILNRHTANVH